MNDTSNTDLPDINADLGQRAVMDTQAMDWEPSPSGSVWRKPLYRTGGEFGPVTSIVRYDPGGSFAPHTHPEGEEVFVLEGVFADEHGEYPAGTWFLNPDGSRHTPRSPQGCIIFVRLRQFPGKERPQLVHDTATIPWERAPEAGVSVKTLYAQDGYPERVELLRLEPGVTLPQLRGVEEIFVLDGEFHDEQGDHKQGAWLRCPVGGSRGHTDTGCVLYRRVVNESS